MTNFQGDQAKKNPKWPTHKIEFFKIANFRNIFVKISWMVLGLVEVIDVGQSHHHIGWATSIFFKTINPTNPRINPWNFHKKKLRIGIFEKLSFLGLTILEFFFQDEKKCFSPIKISQSYLCIKDWVKILVITLVYSKRVSVPNNLL